MVIVDEPVFTTIMHTLHTKNILKQIDRIKSSICSCFSINNSKIHNHWKNQIDYVYSANLYK